MTTQSLRRGQDGAPAESIDPIVAQMAAARASRRLRFRTAFALTWLVLLGGFTLWLVSIDRFDFTFISAQAPYILAGAPLTVFISVCRSPLPSSSRSSGPWGASHATPSSMRSRRCTSRVCAARRSSSRSSSSTWPCRSCGRKRPGSRASRWASFALAFNYGAYLTEIFRAGIEAVPRGQREAALALGLGERRIMRRIVLPQAIRIVTPAIGNEFIAMIKDSALVSFIGVQELLWRAKTIGTANFRTLETLLGLRPGVILTLTMVFSYFQERLEHRMARSDR